MPDDDLGVVAAAVTIPGETTSRVALSGTAVELLQKLWGIHGPLMFHQSGGCCDGSSPMCYPAGEFITAEADILLGLFELPECGPVSFGCRGNNSTIGRTPI